MPKNGSMVSPDVYIGGHQIKNPHNYSVLGETEPDPKYNTFQKGSMVKFVKDTWKDKPPMSVEAGKKTQGELSPEREQ